MVSSPRSYRLHRITTALSQEPHSYTSLSELLDVSERTIRADIAHLEAQYPEQLARAREQRLHFFEWRGLPLQHGQISPTTPDSQTTESIIALILARGLLQQGQQTNRLAGALNQLITDIGFSQLAGARIETRSV